jgi:hypothetical protein
MKFSLKIIFPKNAYKLIIYGVTYFLDVYKMIPLDQALYDKAKRIADETYDKPSAYKSGFIQKKYKEMGGKYKETGQERPLQRWFKEDWTNIASNEQYPVLRPSKRINKNTPLTLDEISPENARKQIQRKQRLRTKNLPPFTR